MIDKVNHVRTQLMSIGNKLKIDKKPSSSGLWICCPFHAGGNENTPSNHVNLIDSKASVGHFFCFGCRESGAWNKLATALNLAGFKASDRINDVYAFSLETSEARETHVPLEDFRSLARWYPDRMWRSITPETVRKFNGRMPEHPYRPSSDFLYFPVEVNDRYVGGIYARRHVTKRNKDLGQLSYINTKGAWTKSALFGYNLAKTRKNQPLWLVEGPRDTMKTYQVGGRVVGTCGAYYSEQKRRLIEALDPPALILGFDPDEAGNLARDKFMKGLSMFPIYHANFPEGKDPGCFRPKSFQKMMLKLGFKV